MLCIQPTTHLKLSTTGEKKNILHVSQQIVCSDLEQQSDKGLYQYGFRVVADTTFLHRLRGGNLKKGTVHNDKMYKKQI